MLFAKGILCLIRSYSEQPRPQWPGQVEAVSARKKLQERLLKDILDKTWLV
jgi:hypothetical protein